MNLRFVLSVFCTAFIASQSFAQLYSEAFDSSAADITFNAQPDTAASFVNYGNFTRGSSTFSIPESPRMIAGSADTSGILLEANLVNGAGQAINVLAGATPLTLSGSYRVSYDVWLNLNNDPTPSGSTEQLLWGVGNNNLVVEGRNTRNNGVDGTWGWLASENGYGTEDTAIFEDGTELADLGDTQTFEDLPFNTAFPCNFDGTPSNVALPDPPNGAAANDWVQVDIDVTDNGDGTSDVTTYFNFVEFFSQTVATDSTVGSAMLGYEDPFGSVNDQPESTFGLFDNFTISENPVGVPTGTIPVPTNCVVPEPGGAVLMLIGLMGLVARRR